LVVALVEQTVGLDGEKTYAKLKAVLVARKCRVTSEQPPVAVSVVQGSVWGISPKSAQKTVIFTLSTKGSETRVVASSRLSAKWRELAFVGTMLAAVMVLLCLWIGLDLQAFAAGAAPGFWSWIVTDSTVGLVLANLLAKLAFGMAVFLLIVIVLEGLVVYYASHRVNAFAEEILKTITQD
jgi:hypothetical protein